MHLGNALIGLSDGFRVAPYRRDRFRFDKIEFHLGSGASRTARSAHVAAIFCFNARQSRCDLHFSIGRDASSRRAPHDLVCEREKFTTISIIISQIFLHNMLYPEKILQIIILYSFFARGVLICSEARDVSRREGLARSNCL